MACWKMAPALAAGNCIVLKPAKLTPLSVLMLMELIQDLLPPGVINVVNGSGSEIGEYLATSPRIAKVAFTGSTEVGLQIMSYAARKALLDALTQGYYLEPTVLFGKNSMRVFQEEIFGPVLAVTTFKTMDDALEIANDTHYGLGAEVWSRNSNIAYRMGRGIQAGRVWTNIYHAYPAHAAFGGYKQSGIGCENHKMMLEYYQQTKCLLVSYSDKPLGLF